MIKLHRAEIIRQISSSFDDFTYYLRTYTFFTHVHDDAALVTTGNNCFWHFQRHSSSLSVDCQRSQLEALIAHSVLFSFVTLVRFVAANI
jgi:hypothetical protein